VRRVVLISVALALLAPDLGRSAVPKDFVGVVSDDVFAGKPDYRDRTLATQQAIGVGLIRQTFDWARIEHGRGVYDFSAYDRFVAAAARHGIEILPVLFHPPPFRSAKPRHGAKPGTYFPKRYSDLGVFGAEVARRYGPGGTLWAKHPNLPELPITAYQVWNEPNLAAYSPPRPSAARYVSLLRATANGIRAVDPAAVIVSAGMPDSALSRPNLFRFVTAMYRAHAEDAFDVLAINPYAPTAPGLIRKLEKVRRIMVRFHDESSQLWVTEMGWADRGPRSAVTVGPAGQASRLAESIAALYRARERLNLRGFVYYSWRDGRTYAPRHQDFWGLHTGLLRLDGSRKPAFAAFKSAVAGIDTDALSRASLQGH
jgi:hypothetical protein